MKHIGICDHNMPGLSDFLPDSRRRISVIGEAFNIHARLVYDFIQLAFLILRERLCRK